MVGGSDGSYIGDDCRGEIDDIVVVVVVMVAVMGVVVTMI